jgi:hypothetical protein
LYNGCWDVDEDEDADENSDSELRRKLVNFFLIFIFCHYHISQYELNLIWLVDSLRCSDECTPKWSRIMYSHRRNCLKVV